MNAWWSGDLGSEKWVGLVMTFNRRNAAVERLTDYEVRVGNDPHPYNNTACPGLHTDSKAVPCNLVGRYVGIVLVGRAEYLHMAEVEAYEWIGGTKPVAHSIEGKQVGVVNVLKS